MFSWIQNVSKKWIVTTVAVIAVIAVVGVSLLNGGGPNTQGAAPAGTVAPGQPGASPAQRGGPRSFPVETQVVKLSDMGGGQVFTGSITPQYTTNVSSRVSGRVTEVMVKVGDRVKAGDPLAKLDTSTLQQQISQQENALAVSSAQLQKAIKDQANAEATAEKRIASQRATNEKSILDLQNQIATLKQQVAISQANFNKAISDQQNTIAAAKQAVAISQQSLNSAIVTYNTNLENAKNALTAQQDSYLTSQANAINNLQSLQLDVQAAQNAYIAAVTSRNGIDAALVKLQQAQLKLEQAQNPSSVSQTALINAQNAVETAEASQAVQLAQEQLNRDLITLTNAQTNLSMIMETNSQTVQKDQLALANAEATLQLSLSSLNASLAQNEQDYINSQSKEGLAVNQAQYQQAQTNLRNLQEQLQDGVLLSPVDGVVTAINTPVGQNAGTQANIVSIAAVDPVQATVSISEATIGKIKVGMEMKVNVPTLNKTFDGIVSAVRPTLDAVTKSYGVDIQVNDPKHELLPGMFATSSLKSEGRKAIMVPADAVLSQPSGNAVFIVQEGRARKVSVKVGTLTSALFEITSGLKEGDEIVVKGQELLSDRAAVQVVQPGQEGAAQPSGGQRQQGAPNGQPGAATDQQGNQQGNQRTQRQQGNQGGQNGQSGQNAPSGQGGQGNQRQPQTNQQGSPQGGQGQTERAGGSQ
ncbi:efflux RND transporter periplasmic adaptor subunit [Paenibacillus sp. GD4]|uniref:efflux RND transporter periplasmic adaptor subunit n=1 Tax=Paenibacillus sp. GD4 TaxID=3068890 RepID=UPI0027966A7C|nr:efflux RND transporter periplasmic adaptor subunit [Paenibacillus sp. GD4]MDQ1912854.1 efflux RND transporter periplasmic adaptor subunit [Paenibacillus sp. GD4]